MNLFNRSADNGCPFVSGADQRIALPFVDPKSSDNTPQQDDKYMKASQDIAMELSFVMQLVKQNANIGTFYILELIFK